MKNKGFTLIELLAVIIIIGVIAVITIPKVNDQITQSRINIAKDSALNYKKAVNEYLLRAQMNKNIITLNGRYSILNGNIGTYEIEANGSVPTEGFLTYRNNELTSGCLYINNYAVTFTNGDVSSITKETCDAYVGYVLSEIVTTGDGLYESTVEPGRYIYKGEAPNNYIYINEGTDTNPDNVLYRIISFESDGTVKVVRNESIGDIAWDPADARPASTHSYCTDSESYGCNVWGNQSNTYLGNTTFTTKGINFYYEYFKTPTSSTIEAVNDGGTISADAYLNTYLNPISQTQTNKWDKAFNVDKYIVEHSFNVGGIYYTTSYGGSKGITKEKQEEKSLTWNGKIGLMNITEFVEASTNSECTLWNNYYYNPIYYYNDEGASNATFHAPENDNYPCKTYNWTITENNQWSLTPSSILKYNVWSVSSTGSFNGTRAYNTSYGVRPAFYLKSTTKISGSGTSTNPYYIVS